MNTCPKCGAKAWKTVDGNDRESKFCYYECGSNGWTFNNPDLASRSDACRIAELEAENAKLKADNANIRNDLRLLREGLVEALARASELEAENAKLRAALAMSKDPCVYCQLPKEEMAKCKSGFPGCGRADDMTGCHEFGAAMEADSLKSENAKLKEELALWKPLTPEEAEKAYAAETMPMSDEQGKRLVDKALDPAEQLSNSERIQLANYVFACVKEIHVENVKLKAELAAAREDERRLQTMNANQTKLLNDHENEIDYFKVELTNDAKIINDLRAINANQAKIISDLRVKLAASKAEADARVTAAIDDIDSRTPPEPELMWVEDADYNCLHLMRGDNEFATLYLSAKNMKPIWRRRSDGWSWVSKQKYWPYDDLDRAKKEVEAEFTAK